MADAQYIIDIAAEMPGGEVTAEQLDDLTKELLGAGRGAETFSAAMKQSADALDVARAASKAADAALADASSEYGTLERAAAQAAKAVERAARKQGGAVDVELFEASERANAALEAQARTLAKLEREADDARGAEARLAKQMRNVSKLGRHVDDVLGDSTRRVSVFRGALGDVGGPLGELGERALFPVQAFADLSEEFGTARAKQVLLTVGSVALVAALVAVTAAVVAGTLALGAYAAKMADAARTTDLQREAAEALHPELAALSHGIAGLEDETGVGSARLRELSNSLRDAKVSAGEMPAALRAAALAEAALGQGGAAQFVSDLKAGKLAVDEFAFNAEAKFGGIVARQMLGLEAQGARFSRLWSRLFTALPIEPVLRALDRLVGLFAEGTASADAMRLLLGGLFAPFVGEIDDLGVAIEAFALKALIELTKIYIGARPFLDRFGELVVQSFGWFVDHGEEVAFVLSGIAIGVVAVTAAVGGLIAVFAKLSLIQVKLTREALSLGHAIVEGLARGILGAGSAVFGAVNSVVGGAIDFAEDLLGIDSPSKVFTEIGEHTGDGFVRGVDRKQPEASMALDRLTTPSATPATAGAQQAPSAARESTTPARGGASATFDGATFNFFGVEGAEDAERRFEEMLTMALEGDALAVEGAA